MKLKIEIANTYQLKRVCKYTTIYIPRTRQMFSSSEKFKYNWPFIAKLWAVELAISFRQNFL